MRGAWIEIVVRLHINTIAPIAPYTGSVNWNLMFLLLLLLAKSRSHVESVNWNSVLTLLNKLLNWSLPMRGARIEIETLWTRCMQWYVAPHTGRENWNEVTTSTIIPNKCCSPRRERELKSSANFKTDNASLSLYTQRARIEIPFSLYCRSCYPIVPLTGSVNWNGDTITEQSYSLSKRERELKQAHNGCNHLVPIVQ